MHIPTLRLLPRFDVKQPAEPYRVVPVAAAAAGLQGCLDPVRAVRRVARVGGDEAAEHLLAARRLARRKGGGAPAVIVAPAMSTYYLGDGWDKQLQYNVM